MKQNESGQNLDISDLDKSAEMIGMGGNLSTEKDSKKYKERMERRKEVQIKRVKERNKEKGLVLIFTGIGKGKTTAALGLAIRAIGHDENVVILQFIKGGWEPGERKALKLFGERLSWHSLGEGFTWETQDRERDEELISLAWKKSLEYLSDKSYKLVILDEINIAIKLGYLSVEKVIEGILLRPPLTHVVLTGRGAPQKLIEIADLVTEMKLIKHPFREQGIKAQKGIEF